MQTVLTRPEGSDLVAGPAIAHRHVADLAAKDDVEVAIGMAQAGQVFGEQREVRGLFAGHAQPVQVVVGGQAGEAPHGVQRQVDGIE